MRDSALELLKQICTMPGTLKTWRSAVADAYSDARFFKSPVDNALRWKVVIFSYFSLDKERLTDALGEI